MEIESIFAPNVTNQTNLFVTFKKETSFAKIFEKTRIMRAGSRIINYVPVQFKYRAKAVREIEYQLRCDRQFQTRMKIGLSDIELWKRKRGSRDRWERVLLPDNLPTIDFSITVDNTSGSSIDSLSPPK